MKLLILCLFLISCNSNEVKESKKEPMENEITSACKRLDSKKYSPQFSELVCALNKSSQNPELKSIVLAQWILESGRGNSKLASKFLNFGGLKWREEMKPYASPISYEAWDGRTDYIEFKTVEKFIEGYWHFINRYPYKGWRKYKTDPVNYIRFIVKSGYCPDNGYTESVLLLEKEALELLK